LWRPERHGARLRAGEPAFIFASYTAHRRVGISVGIGSNRRQKLLYIQMVMAVVECRPGAPFLNMRTLGAGCPPGPNADRILLFGPTIRIYFSDTMIASTTLDR
jgi:hypothetical protein